MTPGRSVLVVGVGNAERGDDGVGPFVAGRLAGTLPPGAAVRVRGDDVLALVDDCAGCDALVCVDCAAADGMPGRVHRFDLGRGDTLPLGLGTLSSHGHDLAAALALAHALGVLPGWVVVYAVEGETFDLGRGLTPTVERSACGLADCVRDEITTLLDMRQDAAPQHRPLAGRAACSDGASSRYNNH